METFKERLLELMNFHGITGKDLGLECGVSRGAVNRWTTRDQMPAADTAVKIAKRLGTTVEYLITGEDASGYSQPVLDLAVKIDQLSQNDRLVIASAVDTMLRQKYIQEKGETLERHA